MLVSSHCQHKKVLNSKSTMKTEKKWKLKRYLPQIFVMMISSSQK